MDTYRLAYDEKLYQFKKDNPNSFNIQELFEMDRQNVLRTDVLKQNHWQREIKEAKKNKQNQARKSQAVILMDAERLIKEQRGHSADPSNLTMMERTKSIFKSKQLRMTRKIRHKSKRCWKRLTGYKIPRQYIISYRNNTKANWDIFILAFAFQNSFLVPVDLAFQPDFSNSFIYSILDTMVEIIFIVDILL
mmetsp:Transcript_22329/g.34565  ORF Transcript_22329/g.34565 Transcript_22329/m.34565 type:complete len:192 (-) Transcript_22329:3414-3989(-)